MSVLLPGLFKQEHMFVFHHAAGQGQWYFPGMTAGDSSVLCWPVSMREVRGTSYKWFYFSDTTAPQLVSIVELNDNGWMGQQVQFRSWVWQCEIAKAKSQLQPGVRIFAEGPQEPVTKIAARNAYWSMSKSNIMDIAKHLGVTLEDGSDLFQVVFDMVSDQLDLDEDATLQIVFRR